MVAGALRIWVFGLLLSLSASILSTVSEARPVKVGTALRHPGIPLNGRLITVGDIHRVGGDLRCNHPFSDVVDVGKAKVLGRSHVTEKIRSGHSGEGPADGTGDVIVAGSDIRDQRT